MVTHEEVIALFHRVGSIFSRPSVFGEPAGVEPVIHLQEEGPAVYCWVMQKAEEAPRIVYLGKAGRTVAQRHDQHRAGYGNSVRGKSHAAELVRILDAGYEVGIWSYQPGNITVDGVEGSVSIHSAMEEHLLRVIEPKPHRNREGSKVVVDLGEDATAEVS